MSVADQADHQGHAAVDLDTGALLAVTAQGADVGDTTSLVETAIMAAEQIEAASAAVGTPTALAELVADRGYHSNQTLVALHALSVRSYIAEPERGRRIVRVPLPAPRLVWSSTPVVAAA